MNILCFYLCIPQSHNDISLVDRESAGRLNLRVELAVQGTKKVYLLVLLFTEQYSKWGITKKIVGGITTVHSL